MYQLMIQAGLLLLLFSILLLPGRPATAGGLDRVEVLSQAVWNSIESHLTAIAVNGREITPTLDPRAVAGDVITFRVLVRNTYSRPLREVLCGASWGRGLIFQGNLSGNLVRYQYDDEALEIEAKISEIPARPPISADSGDSPGPSDVWYTFDLMVVSCQDLSVEVYTDELYSCRSRKKYYVTPQIRTPEIEYVVETDFEEFVYGHPGKVSIAIRNIGRGAAVDLALDSNLHRFPATVSGLSAGFTHEETTGKFLAERVLDPGQTLDLHFDLRPDMEMMGRRPEAEIFFRPRYADACGLDFAAPETVVRPRPGAALPPETTLHGADLKLRVTPECLRLEPGEPLTWTIHVTNRGDDTATDVMVQNILGDHLVLDRTAEDMTALSRVEENAPTPGRTRLTWNIGDIAPSRTADISLTARPREIPDSPWLISSGNVVRLAADCVDEDCLVRETTAPCFTWPGECIDGGDVFGGPGRVHGFFSLTHLYKSNLYRSDAYKKSSLATYLTPGVWVAAPAARGRPVEIVSSSASPGGFAVRPFYPRSDRLYQSYLMYSPQFEFYHHASENDFVSHRMDGFFRYNSRHRLSFQVVDQFKRSHDSISFRRYAISDKYISNLLNMMTIFDPTPRLQLRLDYSNFYLDYDSSGSNMADRMDNAWSLYGFFRLSPKTSLFTEYEFVHINYSRNDLDSTEHRYFGGVRWEVTEKTKGRIKGGFGRKDYRSVLLSDADTWMAEMLVDHDLTARTRLVVNAYRRYEEVLYSRVDVGNLSLNGLTHILTNQLGVAVYHDITSRILFNLDTHFMLDGYEYAAPRLTIKKRKDREVAVSPALRYKYNRWLAFDLTYVYSNRDSNLAGLGYTDHTLLFRAGVFQ